MYMKDSELIRFYEYMDDNYKRVSDGHVVKLGTDSPIITIEKALEKYIDERRTNKKFP